MRRRLNEIGYPGNTDTVQDYYSALENKFYLSRL
jgi:hypothetical protein